MNPSDFEPQADALYKYLKEGLPADYPGLPVEEAKLAAEMRTTLRMEAYTMQFFNDLELRLQKQARERRTRPASQLRALASWLVPAGLGVLLVVGVAWAVQNLLAHPVPMTTAAPSSTAAAPAGTPTPQLPTPTPQPPTFHSQLLRGAEIQLVAGLPDAPTGIPVYLQGKGGDLSPATARDMAGRLGIDGQVYQPAEDYGQKIYIVADGQRRVRFENSSQCFMVQDDAAGTDYPPDSLALGEPAVQAAESFLKERGLLDFAYQAQAAAEGDATVKFFPTIGAELPGILDYAASPMITVKVGKDGVVRWIDYCKPELEEVGRFSILSARQAWEMIQQDEGSSRFMTSEMQLPETSANSWKRGYPLGQPVELSDRFEYLQPAEAGGEPALYFGSIPIVDAPANLKDKSLSGAVLKVTGQFESGPGDSRTLRITAWQQSTDQTVEIEGAVQRDGDRAYLIDNERRLYLPDLPASVPEGKKLYVSGVERNEPELTMDWAWIHSTGGTGGGGGGGSFAELNLSGTPMPDATLSGTPVPDANAAWYNKHLDGAQGTLWVYLTSVDDPSKADYYVQLDESEALPDGLNVQLLGDGLDTLQQYHRLPVRVWGTLQNDGNGNLSLATERVEPAYPDLKVQAWLGTTKPEKWEEKTLIRFTVQDGSVYAVLSGSTDAQYALCGLAGDSLILEGYVVPDKRIDDLPVLDVINCDTANGRKDLADYQMKGITLQPPVKMTSDQLPPGIAKIEKVELAIMVMDPRMAPQDPQGAPVYAQPVWIFSGKYENGKLFQILVQALGDDFLKR